MTDPDADPRDEGYDPGTPKHPSFLPDLLDRLDRHAV